MNIFKQIFLFPMLLHLKLIFSMCFFHILLFQNANSLDDVPDTDTPSAANYANSSTVARPAEASYNHRITDDQQAQNTAAAAMPSSGRSGSASHSLFWGIGQVLAPIVPGQIRQRLLGNQQRGQIVPEQVVPQQLTQNVPGQPDQIEPQSPQKAEISPSNASSSTSNLKDNNNNILLDVIIQSKQKQINPQLRQRKKFSANKPE